MRIGALLFLVTFVQLSTENCIRRIKRLEQRIERLEKRVARIEKERRRLSCETGFVQFKKHCLLFVVGTGTVITWQQARQQCQERGADLVAINSRKIERFIAHYLKDNYPYNKATELYTGLIVTNQQTAAHPYKFSISHHNNRPKSIKWVSSNKSVKTKSQFKYNQSPPFASWSPKQINGSPRGPEGHHTCSQSCISVSPPLPTRRKIALIWNYTCCESERLGYMCGMSAK